MNEFFWAPFRVDLLSSTIGGDAKYSGFLNNFISVQDYEEALNCNLVDLKSMQSIMI